MSLFDVIAATVAGGTNLGSTVAGYEGSQETNAANAAASAAANATNAADTAATNQASRDIANANINEETSFAQNGLSWRIADAAKNGISPLAALGAAEPSFSPVSAVFNDPQVSTPTYTSPLSSVSAGINDMGQNLSRALTAEQSPDAKASSALDLAYKAKQNDLLDVQIANAKLALVSHSMPPGIPLAYTTMQNADGSTSTVPSSDAAQASHGQLFGPALWSVNNKLMPNFYPTIAPSSSSYFPNSQSD